MDPSLSHDAEFEWFLEQFGQPSGGKSVSDRDLEESGNTLPSRLLDYWKVVGFSGFGAGRIWMTNPSEYTGIVSEWIQGTEGVVPDEYYVIARSAFGNLHIWGAEQGYKYEVYPTRGWLVEQPGDRQEILSGNANSMIQAFFGAFDPDDEDYIDASGIPLFDRVHSKLGGLQMNEMYSFQPALAMGGRCALENIEKSDIFVHLSVLRALFSPMVVDEDELLKMAF